jgi:hypothetical protein
VDVVLSRPPAQLLGALEVHMSALTAKKQLQHAAAAAAASTTTAEPARAENIPSVDFFGLVQTVCQALEDTVIPEHFLSLDAASKLPNALRLAGLGTHVLRPSAVFGCFTLLINSARLDSVSLGALFDLDQLQAHLRDILLTDADGANIPSLLLRAARAKRLLKQCMRPDADRAAIDQLLDTTDLWDRSQVRR